MTVHISNLMHKIPPERWYTAQFWSQKRIKKVSYTQENTVVTLKFKSHRNFT